MVINKHHTVFKKYAVFKCILGHAQWSSRSLSWQRKYHENYHEICRFEYDSYWSQMKWVSSFRGTRILPCFPSHLTDRYNIFSFFKFFCQFVHFCLSKNIFLMNFFLLFPSQTCKYSVKYYTSIFVISCTTSSYTFRTL